MATRRRKATGRVTAMAVKTRWAGIRRGTILLSIPGMIPIGIGMILGITVIMGGTALGMIPGTMAAIIGTILTGMAVFTILSMVAAVAVEACMPATAIRVLSTCGEVHAAGLAQQRLLLQGGARLHPV